MKCNLREFCQNNLSKIKFYDITLWKSYAATIAFFSSIITIVSFFVTPKKYSSKLICLAIFIIFLIIVFGVMWWKANHKENVSLSINNTKVEIFIGDIFDQILNPEKHEGEITVIAVNDYYDDIVDDRIVSRKSLHGQYINKIKEERKLATLNKQIKCDAVLNRIGNPKEYDKRKVGKKIKYDLVSMVEFENYVLTALLILMLIIKHSLRRIVICIF